jgi:hypothetical protein
MLNFERRPYGQENDPKKNKEEKSVPMQPLHLLSMQLRGKLLLL